MTACIGNSPGQLVKIGSMGRPLPGIPGGAARPRHGRGGRAGGRDRARPVARAARTHGGVLRTDPEKTAESRASSCPPHGRLAVHDDDGYLTYIGRSDDVFKASDYKISPFELESVLLEHELVVEAAVIPSPDPTRLAVPKAYVCLTADAADETAAARSVFAFTRTSACRRTCGCGSSSSCRSCRRPSRARSVAWSCGRARPSASRRATTHGSTATATTAERSGDDGDGRRGRRRRRRLLSGPRRPSASRSSREPRPPEAPRPAPRCGASSPAAPTMPRTTPPIVSVGAECGARDDQRQPLAAERRGDAQQRPDDPDPDGPAGETTGTPRDRDPGDDRADHGDRRRPRIRSESGPLPARWPPSMSSC